ncbi:MAG: autotransporter outer membrane beta-barrel domain-containing protein [Cyclobacteriaceae bacterium]|nr:autotransporter outer membrane beta-barrel domain-containing protein [Cyclobacteriaceae bacterium]
MIKRIVLGIVFLSCSNLLFAQFEKGGFMVGGNVSANFSEVTNTNSIYSSYNVESFFFQPRVGYFVMDNLSAGIGIAYSSRKETYKVSSFYFSSNSISATPFVRYYLSKFYFEGSLGFGSTQSEDNFNNGNVSTRKGSINNWALVGGYTFLLNKYVAIEPQVGYQKVVQSTDGSNYSQTNSGFFLQLGVQVYIHKN